MQEHGGDWIKWHKNPLLGSHMGEVWERQIRSAKAILLSLLKIHGQSLDESLMTEVEGILNSRPLTIETINDQAFNHFLLLTFWQWNQRLFHYLQRSSWSLMFVSRDDGEVCNILLTNFGLAGEKNIWSRFKNVKNGQEEETLGYWYCSVKAIWFSTKSMVIEENHWC